MTRGVDLSPPEALRCKLRARRERLELGPCDLLMNASAEPAVGRGDDVLAADQICETRDPVSHQLGMLDDVRRVADDPRNRDLPFRELHVLPQTPLVLMADIAG